jgi:flagellar hook protein FlgE
MRKSPIYAGKLCTSAAGIARQSSLSHGWRCLLGLGLVVLTTISSLAWDVPAGGEAGTGIMTDLAISGPGYFVVRDTTMSDGSLAITRHGGFKLDADGYLITDLGWRVEGYSDIALNQVGDIRISSDGAPSWAVLTSYAIQSDGKIVMLLSDGSQIVREQILLQKVLFPANLEKLPYGLRGLTPSSLPLPNPVPPGTAGLGTLLSGQLEKSIPTLTFSRVQSPPPASAQGILTSTGIPTDLAIQGSGFFIVRDTNSNELHPTRAGAFYLDRDGHLINYAGMRVQGYSETNLSTVGDIEINTNGIVTSNSAIMVAFSIDWSGRISAYFSDGTISVRGQVLLENCNHPELLMKTNFGLYTSVAAAGPWTPLTPPRTADLGLILSGTVELGKFDDAILECRKHLNFFEQNMLVITTNPTDLAISGTGFFTLRDPTQDVLYATRNGAFHLDASNRLVDTNGFRVQGLTDSTGATVGDIIIDANDPATFGNSNATIGGFAIDNKGVIYVLTNGNGFIRGQVLLQNFRDLQALKPETNQLYSNVSGALPMHPIGIARTQELGLIFSGALEVPDSPQVLQLPLQTGYRLFVSDLVEPATVEASTDLRTWIPVGQVAGSIMEDAEFFDTNAPTMSQRFYRLKIPGS